MSKAVLKSLSEDHAGGTLFMQGLDIIAELNFDQKGMNERLKIVEGGAMDHIITALDINDSDLRCKAANALGCLSANPEAAQLVLR